MDSLPLSEKRAIIKAVIESGDVRQHGGLNRRWSALRFLPRCAGTNEAESWRLTTGQHALLLQRRT
jgi:hypothetical protein